MGQRHLKTIEGIKIVLAPLKRSICYNMHPWEPHFVFGPDIIFQMTIVFVEYNDYSHSYKIARGIIMIFIKSMF